MVGKEDLRNTTPRGKRLVHETRAAVYRRGEALATQAPYGDGLYGANASPLPTQRRTAAACRASQFRVVSSRSISDHPPVQKGESRA